MDILIKGERIELPKVGESYIDIRIYETGEIVIDGDQDKTATAIELPPHNDLADKSVIIERMGDVYEALYDKVDKKALSECHVAFLKAVMYAPTVIPSSESTVVLEANI